MPFLTLKFDHAREDEVLAFEGEARLAVSLDSITLGGPGGLVSIEYSDEDPRDVDTPTDKTGAELSERPATKPSAAAPKRDTPAAKKPAKKSK